MKKKVIGYICDTNPFEDRLTWSGLIYKIREAIESAGYQVVWIPYDKTTKYVHLCEKIRWRLYKLLGRKQILGGCHFLPETYALARSIEMNEQFDIHEALKAAGQNMYIENNLADPKYH